MRVPQPPAISLLPFKEELKTYRFRYLRDDLFAALGVALMSVPQSIAYSLLAGLPPIAGLLSAIFGTIFTAGFGASRYLVSGPSTGVAILIQTSIADILYNYFEPSSGPVKEALVLHILSQLVLLMGLIQIGAAFFNVSKLLQFVSRPVTLGYFAGIAAAVVVNQLFYFLGIPSSGGESSLFFKAWQLVVQIGQIDWMAVLVGVFAMVLLVLLRRQARAIPDALLVLIGASLLGYGLNAWLGPKTISTIRDLPFSGELALDLKAPFIDFKLLNRLFPAATAIAFVAILEVFSVARNFPAKGGRHTQVNQDVFGLGIGNIVLSCFAGAIPSSGSPTRTSLNYRLNAKTRLAAIFSGILTAAIAAFCWPLLRHIPLPALGGLLIVTVSSVVNVKEIALAIRVTQEDRWVFFFTFGSCLIFSLDIAFFVGIVISIGTYLRRSAIPHLVEYAFNSKGRLMIVNPQDDVHRKVRIIGISGDLYFATADVLQSALQPLAEDPNVRAIVLRLNNVYHMDASMCLAIQNLYDTLASSQRHLVISGLTEEVWHVFHRAGLVKRLGLDNLYFTDESNPQFSTWKACLHAQELIHRGH